MKASSIGCMPSENSSAIVTGPLSRAAQTMSAKAAGVSVVPCISPTTT